MKPVKYRTCELCGERKRTTNREDPFIGEECLRLKENRLKLLSPKLERPKPTIGAYIVLAILITTAFVLGAVLF